MDFKTCAEYSYSYICFDFLVNIPNILPLQKHTLTNIPLSNWRPNSQSLGGIDGVPTDHWMMMYSDWLPGDSLQICFLCVRCAPHCRICELREEKIEYTNKSRYEIEYDI